MNDRQIDPNEGGPWDEGMERIPLVKLEGNEVHIENFRNYRYECHGICGGNYESRVVKVDELEVAEFIVVPFASQPDLAHTMMSFGFTDGQYLVVSVEARLRAKQRYSIWKGLIGRYPIMYVIADERDSIGYRTECRGDEVYLYHVDASEAEMHQFLRSVLERAAALHVRCERYNTLWNNCATNIWRHINDIWPGRVPWGWRVLMPAGAAYLAYRLGFLRSDQSFDQTRESARINDLAAGNSNEPDFSQRIRPNRG